MRISEFVIDYETKTKLKNLMKAGLTILFLLVTFTGFTQPFLPISGGEIVKHTFYTLAYSEENEQAFWVLYELTPAMVKGKVSRGNDFRSDPQVSTLSASLADYKKSGYDRGHLCPAADMRQSNEAMSETFFLSNMSPQVPRFNRAIWKKLESTVRSWSIANDGVWVATGPVFKDNLGSIGEGKVTVPGYFYKIVYDFKGEQKMIALVLPNRKGENQLVDYIVSVDSIEALTGIDFFPQLEDSLENFLESKSDENLWSF